MEDDARHKDQPQKVEHLSALGITFRPALTGSLPTGDHRFERYVRQSPEGLMPLGAHSYSNSVFRPVKRIGRYCSIASGVHVMGANHPVDWASTSPVFYRARPNKLMGGKGKGLHEFDFRPRPVSIGNDVWIGQDVLLSAGVKIGDGAVIAAGAVVTKDVAPYSVVGGVPAQTIRMRFKHEVVERLSALAWWRFDIRALEGLDPTDPVRFADALDQRIAAGSVAPCPEDRRCLADWLLAND